MYCTYYDSPLGKLLLTCTEEGLTGIYMNRELAQKPEEHPILLQTKQWLDAYFRGENPFMNMPLSLEGTEFQKQVWNILLTIPYGKTRSYGEIAREMAALSGKEKMSAHCPLPHC